MELLIHQKTLHLKEVFATSHGAVDTRSSIILEIQCQGTSGFGELVEIKYYGKSIPQFLDTIQLLKSDYQNKGLEDIPELLEEIHLGDLDPFIICALDCALLDLWTKKKGESIRTYLSIPFGSAICSTLTIGINSPEASAQFVQNNPWPIYKVKLGTEHDQSVIESIRKVTLAPLVVDANSGWDLYKSIEMAQWLKSQGVLFIEQPLPADHKEDIQLLHSKSVLPIIADESCHTERDLDFCLQYYDGINIKLMKCGGISPAIKMIHRARQANKVIMVGCMTESSIGISAAAQIAPLVDFCDLDGSILIDNDPAYGVKLYQGIINYPDRMGHGGILIQ